MGNLTPRNMGCSTFEETLEIDIALVEATYPTIESPEGYPLPRLTPTDQTHRRAFRAVGIENDFLRVRVLPALGGRIWSIFDKRTQVEILPVATPVSCRKGGSRGAQLDAGIQLQLQGRDRANSLGPVSVQSEPEDSDRATLWIGDVDLGTPLGFHVALSLEAEDCCLVVETRILNRSLEPVEYDPAWVAHLTGWEGCGACGAIAYDRARGAALGLFPKESFLDHATYREDTLRLGRFSGSRVLAPRQTDSFRVEIVPVSRMESLRAIGGGAALGIGEELVVQPYRSLGEGRILLASQSGETLQAPVELEPGRRTAIPLVGELADPHAVAIRSASGETLVQWPREIDPPLELPAVPDIQWPGDLQPQEWRRLTVSPALRHLAFVQLALEALREQNWDLAHAQFESSLLYNADDPLCWWGKAAALRLQAGEPVGEDLLNAHYLAPLDPLLRVESFLAQSPEMGKDANPLLAGLGSEGFVDAACLLIEHGLADQAARLLDEAVRHQDAFMLRYLLAYCYLTGSRLAAEAAQQVELAGRLPDAPPFPWRTIERKVLARLGKDFPRSEPLSRRIRLLESAISQTSA